jgi:hypothetical protein
MGSTRACSGVYSTPLIHKLKCVLQHQFTLQNGMDWMKSGTSQMGWLPHTRKKPGKVAE